MNHGNITWRWWRGAGVIAWLVMIVCAPGRAAIAGPNVATNLVEVLQLAGDAQSKVISLRLEGNIWWSDGQRGRLVFQDESGVRQVEVDIPGDWPKSGERIRLEGECLVNRTKDAVKLTSVPVVDNDGLHAAEEKSGSVELKAGRHPIRVAWFNRTGKLGLRVEYEGPGLARQTIPAAALFHTVAGTTNQTGGLEFASFEGSWWTLLPDFNHLPAIARGTVSNFDIGVRSRTEHVGLRFIGYLEIPHGGRYTFHLKSDDGSRLYIGEPTLRVVRLGRSELPPPRRVEAGRPMAEQVQYCRAEIEGAVSFVNRLEGRLEFELNSGAERLRVIVADDSACSFALLSQNRIRAVGVGRSLLQLDGRPGMGEFLVQGWHDIQQVYITPELWATYPLITISNALALELASGATPVAHMRGKVRASEVDRPTLLDDATGQIALESGPRELKAGQTVEVLGRLVGSSATRSVQCVVWRRISEGGDDARELPVLTIAEQVHQLSRDELKRGYPVKLRGVIMGVLQGDAAILQDETRGIYVGLERAIPLQVGDFCEVEGTADPGDFSPFIRAVRLNNLGSAALLPPVRPTWDQLLNGSMHCQYVELEGVVTAAQSNSITLLTRGGRINVQLDAVAAKLPAECQNALIRLRGCLFASWDAEAQRVKVGDIRLNQQWVEVVQPALADPFAIPTKRIGELLRFDPQAGALQRVKIFGQVLFAGKNECLLQNAGSGLRVAFAIPTELRVGDVVEAVGFPDYSGTTPVIQEAVTRFLKNTILPKPLPVPADELVQDEFDSKLVEITGVVAGISISSDRAVFEIRNGTRHFTALLGDGKKLENPAPLGSRVQLTGVYVGQGGNRVLGRPIDSFQLLLNSAADIKILARPPWWTLKRLFAVVGLLAGVLLLALVWIKQLQRRVTERTRQLEAEILERQRAERRREIEQERARVAHDLHDDLGAGLTRVNMLTSLASNPATSGEEKTRYLADLNEMARDMVTSLDEIVWAVNPRNDTVNSLVGYFGAHAQRLLALASVKFGLAVSEELPDLPLDPQFRHEMLMAFKEAINNIVRHSGATKVWLRAAFREGILVLEVEDNGRGIEPGKSEAGADGLVNMRARLSALGGRCEIQSDPAKGTTVRFEAPLTDVTL